MPNFGTIWSVAPRPMSLRGQLKLNGKSSKKISEIRELEAREKSLKSEVNLKSIWMNNLAYIPEFHTEADP